MYLLLTLHVGVDVSSFVDSLFGDLVVLHFVCLLDFLECSKFIKIIYYQEAYIALQIPDL